MEIDLSEARLAARLRVKDMADRVELLDRLALLEILAEREDLAFRVADMELNGTEWAVRYPDGTVKAPARNAEQLNRRLAARNGGTLVQRDVYAPGPWRVAQ